MTDNLFTAYFVRNNHSNGNTAMEVPEDGAFPQLVSWEGSTYQLSDADYDAKEAHYDFYS